MASNIWPQKSYICYFSFKYHIAIVFFHTRLLRAHFTLHLISLKKQGFPSILNTALRLFKLFWLNDSHRNCHIKDYDLRFTSSQELTILWVSAKYWLYSYGSLYDGRSCKNRTHSEFLQNFEEKRSSIKKYHTYQNLSVGIDF